jgi:Ni/Co efflux regulator RcnB
MNARTRLWVTLIAPLLTHQVVATEAEAAPDLPQKAKAAEKQLKQQHKHQSTEQASAALMVTAGISLTEARELARRHQLTGQHALPPGIAKNLIRGKALPAGIARKTVPQAMLAELPQHQGYEWRMAGTDLILVSVATAVVADVLFGVLQ